MLGKKHRFAAAGLMAFGILAGLLFSGALVRAEQEVPDADFPEENVSEEELPEGNVPEILLRLPDPEACRSMETKREDDAEIHTLIYPQEQCITIEITDPDPDWSETEVTYRIGLSGEEEVRLVPDALPDMENISVIQEEDRVELEIRITDGMLLQDLYVHAENRAGGAAELSADSGTEKWRYLVDETPPSAELTAREAPAGFTENVAGETVPLYADSTEYLLTVTDGQAEPGAAEETWACAGIEKVEWYVQSDLPGVVKTSEATALQEDGSLENCVIPVIMENAEESNDIQLVVSVTDRAGNRTIATQELAIDRLPPRVSLFYDNNDVQNGSYFRDGRNLTVRVEDLNFDAEKTAFDTQVDFQGWQWDGGAYETELAYEADGAYRFAMSAVDAAGNPAGIDYTGAASNAAPQAFVIDRTAPVIRLSFDGSGAKNGNYYNAARTAVIEIAEDNFVPEDVKIELAADTEDITADKPAAAAFRKKGGNWYSEIRFDRDGVYQLKIRYKDPAGNAAEPAASEEFVIDRTPPEITLQFPDGEDPFSGNTRPLILVYDINPDPSRCVVAGQAAGISQTVELSEADLAVCVTTGNGKAFYLNEPADDPRNDGIYRITVSAADLAGNMAEREEIQYHVNRFGSVYAVSDPGTAALLEEGTTGTAPALAVTEYNSDRLLKSSVSLLVNGSVRTLEEGREYTVRESRTASGWMEYEYRILPAAFQDARGETIQGAYEVTVYSEDAAGNRNTNRTNAPENRLSLSWLIDSEPPVGYIDVTGLKTGSNEIDADRTGAAVYWEDNIGVEKVTVYLNGKPVRILEGEELARHSGSFSLTIEAADMPCTIYAVLTDRAGNETELAHRSFHRKNASENERTEKTENQNHGTLRQETEKSESVEKAEAAETAEAPEPVIRTEESPAANGLPWLLLPAAAAAAWFVLRQRKRRK